MLYDDSRAAFDGMVTIDLKAARGAMQLLRINDLRREQLSFDT